MIASITGRVPHGILFLALNISILFLTVIFLLAPVLARFADRGEDIAENAAQLAHFRQIARTASTPAEQATAKWGSVSARGRGAHCQRRLAG